MDFASKNDKCTGAANSAYCGTSNHTQQRHYEEQKYPISCSSLPFNRLATSASILSSSNCIRDCNYHLSPSSFQLHYQNSPTRDFIHRRQRQRHDCLSSSIDFISFDLWYILLTSIIPCGMVMLL